MDTSLIINSTDTNNKKLQKTIACVNPAVSNSDLKTFAQMTNNLTTNQFVDANRVDRSNVDEEGGGTVIKTEPTLEVGTFSYDGYRYVAGITYNGDGQLFVSTNEATAYAQIYNHSTQGLQLRVQGTTVFSGTLYAAEGDEYSAKSVTFSNS